MPESPPSPADAYAELVGWWDRTSVRDHAATERCRGMLTELRALYRARPDDFTSEMIGTLRRIGEELRRPPPQERPGRSSRADLLGTLKTTFGYESFRPGQ